MYRVNFRWENENIVFQCTGNNEMLQNTSLSLRPSRVKFMGITWNNLFLINSFDVLIEVSCWTITGERQAARIRAQYLKAILRQDIAFFDKEMSTGQVVERMCGDTFLIQDAIGEKVGCLGTHCVSLCHIIQSIGRCYNLTTNMAKLVYKKAPIFIASLWFKISMTNMVKPCWFRDIEIEYSTMMFFCALT